jgi:hypothetical protein
MNINSCIFLSFYLFLSLLLIYLCIYLFVQLSMHLALCFISAESSKHNHLHPNTISNYDQFSTQLHTHSTLTTPLLLHPSQHQ